MYSLLADWRLLNLNNVVLRKTFPWGHSIQKHLWKAQSRPFLASNLFIASDYGGEHKRATHRTYAFLVFDCTPSGWPSAMRTIRASKLTDGRRMSFKQLNDCVRQNALVPYLQAADTLTGHLLVIAIDKRIPWLMCGKGHAEKWSSFLGLKGKWGDKSFENMARKSYIVSLVLSVWSRPMMNVSWITDYDESVANANRLDDTHIFAARMSSLLVQHRMGEFAMNTVAYDEDGRAFEDICAIPDIAAGMTSDICAAVFHNGGSVRDRRHELSTQVLSEKTHLISDWFWRSESTLHKMMIQIDKYGADNASYSVRQIWME